MICTFTGFNSCNKTTSLNDDIQAITYNTDTNTGGIVFTKCNDSNKVFDLFIDIDKENIKFKDVELLEDKTENKYIPFVYKSLTKTRHW